MKASIFCVGLVICGCVVIQDVNSQQNQQTLIRKWEKVGVGLEDASVSTLIFDENETLYAGLTNYGTDSLFVLPKLGKNWKSLSDGLPNQGEVYLANDLGKVLVYAESERTFYGLNNSNLIWSKVFHVNPNQGYLFIRQKADRVFIRQQLGIAGDNCVALTSENNQIVKNTFDSRFICDGSSLVAQGKDSTYHFNEFSSSGYFLLKSYNSQKDIKKSLGNEIRGGFRSHIQDSSNNHYVLSEVFLPNSQKSNYVVQKLTPTRAEWRDITTSLPNSELISTLLIDKSDNIFAFTGSGGVYVLPVGLTSWLKITALELPSNLKIYNAILSPNNQIYIATNNGIFRSIQ